ncbi:probable ATP-dependent RNA helicase DDX56 [Trichogramma pretiosum]|uniref:probable ATP-dependent RNA helicase DDX56 n=1 Tax=Trichogramma pretiosum TaxID=7493 RepID=UPI0006C9B399|nr:probable ATP-dependent RNA helicase DDX56 [Trichogramma pretiosum]
MSDNENEPVVSSDEEEAKQFHEFGLDDRLLKSIAKLGWAEPTIIQEKTIPLIRNGKDVLLRARTGSGKTGAFIIPVIQDILEHKDRNVDAPRKTRCLVLAPSRELCKQIYEVIIGLTSSCRKSVRVVDVSQQLVTDAHKPLLKDNPDIVVTTPGNALDQLKANNLNVKNLKTLIIDEADLVFSFGFEEQIKEVLTFLTSNHQSVLASATLSEDVLTLKKLVLRNPAILKLEEAPIAPSTQLKQYVLNAEENDKAAILYSLLKLSLVRGKTIIFVNTVDRCYKLKLFLEQFGIKSCVLNSELPAVSRCRAVSQFNNGTYEIIIASDEKSLDEPHKIKEKKSKRKKDKESGVARGIDFQFVSNVLNFDFPLDINSYIHRAGRTARGTNEGFVINFIAIREQPLLEEVKDHLKDYYKQENVFQKYEFDLKEADGFRYRSRDAWKAVTRIAVREARLKEIKAEVLNCEKLKSYFQDNPRDLESLKQDKALHTVKLQPHLKDVPSYIVPPSLRTLAGFTTKGKRKFDRTKEARTSAKTKFQSREGNPLAKKRKH